MTEREWLEEIMRLAAEPTQWTIVPLGDGTYGLADEDA